MQTAHLYKITYEDHVIYVLQHIKMTKYAYIHSRLKFLEVLC